MANGGKCWRNPLKWCDIVVVVQKLVHFFHFVTYSAKHCTTSRVFHIWVKNTWNYCLIELLKLWVCCSAFSRILTSLASQLRWWIGVKVKCVVAIGLQIVFRIAKIPRSIRMKINFRHLFPTYYIWLRWEPSVNSVPLQRRENNSTKSCPMHSY